MLEPLIVSFHVIRGSPSPLFVLPFLPEIIRNCLNIGAEVHSFNSIFIFFLVLHLSAFFPVPKFFFLIVIFVATKEL